MKRTSKRYVVSTSAVNCYGYRVLTEGIDYTQFEKNPILLWMHQRAWGNDKNQILPLGRGVELKLEGDQLTCALEFDETDEFAMQVYNKYENGTLSMVSLGAKPLEWSVEPEMMLEGQTGVTVTKSKMTDISCVDFGGNDDACACQLYDADDKKIELANMTSEAHIQLFNSLQQTKNDDKNSMKTIALAGAPLTAILLALNLTEGATEADVQNGVAGLVQLNGTLKSEKVELQTKLTKAESDLAENIKLSNEAKVTSLVDAAITDKKILPAQKEQYIKLANADFDSTKGILDAMTGSRSVAEQIKLNGGQNADEALLKLSWDEAHQTGKLEQIKLSHPDHYAAIYKQEFGVEPKK